MAFGFSDNALQHIFSGCFSNREIAFGLLDNNSLCSSTSGLSLKKAFGAEGFNFAWNDGKNCGQSVPHFHLHIVPRKEGDAGVYEYEPRKFLYRPGEREATPEEELKMVAEIIKENLLVFQ
jgi:hypothetical protein